MDGGPSNSPAFVPPVNRISSEDPMIVRVPLDRVGMAFRMSQQSDLMNNNGMTIRNIKNGG